MKITQENSRLEKMSNPIEKSKLTVTIKKLL